MLLNVNIIKEELPKKGGRLGQFVDLKGGGLARNRGSWYPNAYYKQSKFVVHKFTNPKCMVVFFASSSWLGILPLVVTAIYKFTNPIYTYITYAQTFLLL